MSSRVHNHAAPGVMHRSYDRENALINDGIAEAELVQIEQKAAQTFAVAPTPWLALLETRHGIGGESFIRLGGDDPAMDHELYRTGTPL